MRRYGAPLKHSASTAWRGVLRASSRPTILAPPPTEPATFWEPPAQARRSPIIEPAAQIELSAGPSPRSRDRARHVQKVRAAHRTLDPAGEKALAIGYHPSATARSLSSIPSAHQFMNLYLGKGATSTAPA